MKEIPKLFTSLDKCCGCQCCIAMCPVNAIEIIKKRGFEYPKIDKNKCIKCGNCVRCCPYKQ